MRDQRATIVHACYLGILGREPSAGEVEHHLRMVDPGDASSMADLMHAFLCSPEAAALQVPRFFTGLRPIRSINGQAARQVIGLGTHCFTTTHLERSGLRRWASPFDWVRSPPSMVLHCLQDDFRTYLDRSQFDGHEHQAYRSMLGIEEMFAHHHPAEDRDYASFCRRVDRWRSAMQANVPTLFVLFTQGAEQLQFFRPLVEALRGATLHPALLFVAVEPPDPSLRVAQLHREDSIGDQHVAWRMRPTSALGAIHFDDPMDELVAQRLIREYALDT